MPLLLAWLGALIVKIVLAKYILKLLFLAVITALSSVFYSEITGLLFNLNMPPLHPYIQNGIKVLPVNTMTYITICISALTARWVYVSQVKAGRIMLE